MQPEIWQLTREEYFNDVDRVRADAIAAGCVGEVYQAFKGKGKKLRVVDKYKPLNNLELYEFGKRHHRDCVAAAVESGKPVPESVASEYLLKSPV